MTTYIYKDGTFKVQAERHDMGSTPGYAVYYSEHASDYIWTPKEHFEYNYIPLDEYK